MTNNPIKSVAVYCGGSDNYRSKYLEEARRLSRHLVRRNLKLVYGAGSRGIMGALGGEMLKLNGEVWGVITRRLLQFEKPYHDLTRLMIVETMSLRKAALSDYADALVVLPGGFGTLEEFFETLVAKQLDVISTPLMLLNSDDYWTPLFRTIDHLIANGAIRAGDENLFETYTDIDVLCRRLDELAGVEQADVAEGTR